MAYYTRRRRGYYGQPEPTPQSQLATQIVVGVVVVAVIACLLVIAVNFLPEPS